MNNGRTHAAIVRRKALLSSPVVKVEDKLVLLGDYSYGIDLKGVEFINLLAEKSWRGPPPKRPRRILKLVSHWLQREYSLIALRYVITKCYNAALALLHCGIITRP